MRGVLRVIPIDADAWTDEQLIEVIAEGERLLNIRFNEEFRADLVARATGSVYVVQEACHRACTAAGLVETSIELLEVPVARSAESYVADIVREQSGRYKFFVQNFSLGFLTTELEMYKWILYSVIISDIDNLETGLGYRAVREAIESRHPQGKRLKPGNLTQALNQVSPLQIKKNIKPFVLDYDSANLLLSVVDKGFLIWLRSQDRQELIELLDLPDAGQFSTAGESETGG